MDKNKGPFRGLLCGLGSVTALGFCRDGFVEFRQRLVFGCQEGVDDRQHEQGEQGADGQTRHDDDADAEALCRPRTRGIEQQG